MNDLSKKAILILLLICRIIAYGLAGAEGCNQDVVAEYECGKEYYDSIAVIWDK